MNDSDPRLGLVSASRFDIFALCAGSEQLRRTLPAEALVSEDEYTDSGRKLHKAWETDNTFPLTESELQIYNNGTTTLARIISEWREDCGVEDFSEGEREARLFLHDESTMRPVTSGQLDRHFIANNKQNILVCDFKGLWSPNLTPSERNHQGRVQAVLAANEYGATHVRVSFIRAMFSKSDTCDYSESALRFAERSIFQALWEAEQPGAQRTPGDWCRYCPCKPFCKEAAAYAQLPTVSGNNGDPLAIARGMPIEDVATVWRRKGVVDKIFAALGSRLSALDDAELNRLGLKRTEGKRLDKVQDVKGAFDKLAAEGIDAADLYGAMSFGKEGLVKVIQRYKGCGEKEAAAFWDAALDPFIERDRSKPSIVEL